MALPRETADGRSRFGRAGRGGVIVQHPAVESRTDATDARDEQAGPGAVMTSSTAASIASSIGVLESHLREEARLEGVRLAAREMAHLLNNDLAVAVGCVDLLQTHSDLPSSVLDLLRGVSKSLDAAAHHVEQMQRVGRVVVKQTPAGPSLDLERSRRV